MRIVFNTTEREEGDDEVRTWFALLPVWIDNEIRWLEKVTVRGYWTQGFFWHWNKQKFIENDV